MYFQRKRDIAHFGREYVVSLMLKLRLTFSLYDQKEHLSRYVQCIILKVVL